MFFNHIVLKLAIPTRIIFIRGGMGVWAGGWAGKRAGAGVGRRVRERERTREQGKLTQRGCAVSESKDGILGCPCTP